MTCNIVCTPTQIAKVQGKRTASVILSAAKNLQSQHERFSAALKMTAVFISLVTQKLNRRQLEMIASARRSFNSCRALSCVSVATEFS
jgi:hypothetical protein